MDGAGLGWAGLATFCCLLFSSKRDILLDIHLRLGMYVNNDFEFLKLYIN
jgi:hypothetical protein